MMTGFFRSKRVRSVRISACLLTDALKAIAESGIR
jgi:hypothetical protein